jgi:hypothetical protein
MELVVLSVCIWGSSACSDAGTAYYSQSLEAQRIANEAQHAVEHKVGKENAAVLGSMVGVMVLKRGTINMQRHLNLIVESNSAQLQLHFEQ